MSAPRMTAAPLKSMTGYAQARAEKNGWAVQLSLRSVNHRFLDMRVRLPEGWESLETEIRKGVQERFRRGHVEVTVQVQAAKNHAVSINREVAASYLEAAKALGEEFSVKAEPDIAAILRLPGVASSAPAQEELESLADAVRSGLERAIQQMDQMRCAEGQALYEELTRRLNAVEHATAQVEILAERVRPAYARKLEARVKELIGSFEVDPARLAQEAAFIAERSDATEELARLRSHVKQFRTLLAGGGEAGKKLDFLLQEMQRESNTLLSKASGADSEGLQITQLGLELKSEIEKLREQVQNVE
jgi:uncharacterized protein (TIGR00255 family)